VLEAIRGTSEERVFGAKWGKKHTLIITKQSVAQATKSTGHPEERLSPEWVTMVNDFGLEHGLEPGLLENGEIVILSRWWNELRQGRLLRLLHIDDL
jgi:hypothetical protein